MRDGKPLEPLVALSRAVHRLAPGGDTTRLVECLESTLRAYDIAGQSIVGAGQLPQQSQACRCLEDELVEAPCA